ncbi:PREDICTED: growth arrest-specific protein 1-like isoform X2 [Polistes dominula]|uniref:Growth arrest-specific protein 1-like isoform X2 n=1 Tax=Polistes dominula TaxID=743375 RepID=A0ABM1IYI0_POLDO|nr:PREDICTED: growth arrest-specific protein 1-like isoform X2 [Polistes dominula]
MEININIFNFHSDNTNRSMSRGVYRSDVVLVSMMLLTMMFTYTKSTSISCEDARLRCAYRIGCGMALQHYVTGCASVLQGDKCSESCQHALIALTSTDEGKELMMCQCTPDDEFCQQSKQKVENCRSSVTTAMNKTRVSCRIATWICNADALCQTALSYYNKFCKSMFHGKKCTHRCRNSLNILRRQEKAAKLTTCLCDGSEEYDCKGIHHNMNTLCFGKIHHDYQQAKKDVDDTRTNDILRIETNVYGNDATTVQLFVNRTILTISIIWILLFSRLD